MLPLSAVAVPVLPEGLDEGEHLVAHRLEHLLRGGLLEARPAEIVLVGGEDRLLDGLAGAGGLALLERVQLVEPLDEEQVGELLDDRERVRDAAGPHRVPDAVDLGFEFAGDHDRTPQSAFDGFDLLNLGQGSTLAIVEWQKGRDGGVS